MCKSTECQNCKNNNGVWVISNEILDKETLEDIYKEVVSDINKGECEATVKIVPQEEIDNILNKYIGVQVSDEKVESSTVEVTKGSIKGTVEKMEMNLNKEKEVKRLAEIILREMTDKKLPRVILEEALDIVDDKFLNDATI